MLHLRQVFSRKSSSWYCFLLFKFWFLFCFYTIVFACGGVELCPGAKNWNSCYNFSICHWNSNSITPNNIAKICLLQAYNAIHESDIICLSKSYPSSSVSSSNNNLYIKDFRLFRADHLGNAKAGGVSIYFKESLPERCLHNPDLKEFLIFQVSMNDKRSYVVSLYRAPSQTFEVFKLFSSN